MSVQAIAEALRADVDYREKVVLLVLSNYADDNLQCWPSVDRVAKEAGMPRRTCQRALAELENQGFISRRQQAKHEQTSLQTSRTNFFQISFSKGANMSPLVKKQASKQAQEGCHTCRPKGVTSDTQTIIEPSEEILSSLSSFERSAREEKKSPRGSRIPPGWEPDPQTLAALLEDGWTQKELDRERDRFRDFWTAKAGADARKLDWAATWRNWIRRADDQRGRGPRQAFGGAFSGGNGSAPVSMAGIAARRRLG